jgi:hypothetical protein
MTVLGKHYNPLEIYGTLRRAGAIMPWLFFYLKDKKYNSI